MEEALTFGQGASSGVRHESEKAEEVAVMVGALPRIEITEMYGRLNEGLIQLVEYIPDDKLEWSPRGDLWNFRHILRSRCVFAPQLDRKLPDAEDQA